MTNFDPNEPTPDFPEQIKKIAEEIKALHRTLNLNHKDRSKGQKVSSNVFMARLPDEDIDDLLVQYRVAIELHARQTTEYTSNRVIRAEIALRNAMRGRTA